MIDTTFGLGRDAVIAASAVAPGGSVTALESSAGLFHLGWFGLTEGALSLTELARTAGRAPSPIELIWADARTWLAEAESGSADVVLVDPMFEEPKASDTGFELLRSVADADQLDPSWISEARRIARRWVVVKSGPERPWFAEAGLEPVHSHSNANWWRARGTAAPGLKRVRPQS